MALYVTNIKWIPNYDELTEKEVSDLRHNKKSISEILNLPEELKIPQYVLDNYDGNDAVADGNNNVDNSEFSEYISDYLSEEYGYCHEGFCIEEY